MNTPAHAVLNLLLLARDKDHRVKAAVVGGALIPDLAIVVFYAWQLLLGTAENQIWSQEYYRPIWQAWIDVFNSVPLIVLAMLLCWHFRRYVLLALLASMLLHVFGDLPLHHDDAHRHFFPFSDWRYSSPISYWDPEHYGNQASLVEFSLVFAAAIFMYLRHPATRPWVSAIVAIYLVYWLYVYLVWI